MRQRQRGFTLIEMLVALAVTGVVVVGAHAALGALRDASDRARSTRQRVFAGANIRATLESWLRATTFVFEPPRAGSTPDASDELVIAVHDAGALRPGPHRIRLWVDPGSGSSRAGLRAEITPLADGRATPETIPVWNGPIALQVRYLVRTSSGRHWLRGWTPDAGLPEAIELAIRGASPARLGRTVDARTLPALLELPIAAPLQGTAP